ncbi:hypothetical protein PLANPX_5549 [Lacipirellula parvula]|uniref:Uncharacterized protein n=1 Tax=Lacipirellula parvula TaxID=2650471 RepID=A0A5K7XIS7_9BACT|nr:hypothetical protein PLANPX_5549 [Lacipirellula parvula]
MSSGTATIHRQFGDYFRISWFLCAENTNLAPMLRREMLAPQRVRTIHPGAVN